MISLLRIRNSGRQVHPQAITKTYRTLRAQALLGAILGYMAYYFVRNNFTLSTPFLKTALNLNAEQIGFLSSYMLIAYGISKGVMSSLADKADPKRYMAFGLIVCALINVLMGFSTTFWMFAVLVTLNGFFQGMGVGPCFITIANWFPRKQRGTVGAIWNISHNLGGGLVAPIVGIGFFLVGTSHWPIASYWTPAVVALIFTGFVLYFGKGSPVHEGLPPLQAIMPDDTKIEDDSQTGKNPAEGMSAWQIFWKYVMFNKSAWLLAWMDTFVYSIRFGMISWLPLYLLEIKHFTKTEMGTAFAIFEFAAIPATLLAGYVSDKIFKGYRMPPAIISMVLIFFCLFGYWHTTSLGWTIFFAATVGCLIYIPQCLASVQTMEVVPAFAVGSAVGLRGFMSYVVGTTIGTSIFGVMVHLYGWHAGFYVLQATVLLCILICVLIHLGARKKYGQLQPAAA